MAMSGLGSLGMTMAASLGHHIVGRGIQKYYENPSDPKLAK